MDIKMPDGTIVKNVPEGTTKEQVLNKYLKKDNKARDVVMKNAEGFAGFGSPPVEAALQGASLGFSDEGEAALKSLYDYPGSGVPYTDLYKANVNEIRNRIGKYSNENPVKSTLLGFGGAALTGGTGLKRMLATKAGMARPLLTTAKHGALMGGTAGAGFAPDIKSMPQYILGGSALGFTLPFALQSGMNVGKGIVDLTKKGLEAPAKFLGLNDNAAPAVKAVARAFKRDEIPINQAFTKQAGLGPEGVLADVGGENVKKLAQHVASLPGKSADIAEKTLQSRMNRSVPRLVGALQKSLGSKGAAYQTSKKLTEKALKDSAPFYAKANRELVTVDGSLSELFQRPIMKQAYRQALKKAASDPDWPTGIRIPKVEELSAGKTVPLPVFDATKRALDSMFESTTRGARPDRDLGRIITENKKAMLDILDPVYPDYAKARSLYAGPTAIKNAIDSGKKILSVEPDEMVDLLKSMSQSERDGYITGAVNAITTKIKGSKEGVNAANRIGSYLVRDRLRSAFPDDESFNGFMKAVDIEDTFAELRNFTLRNSPTQPRIGTAKELAVDAAADAAQGRFLSGVLTSVGRWIGQFKNIPEPVRNDIGELLFSDLAKTNQVSKRLLEKMAKQQITQDQVKQLILSINQKVAPPATVTAISELSAE